MSTIADLIERTYRTYLYPPDYEPAMVEVTSTINDSSDPVTFTLGEFVVPEDEELMRLGLLVEVGAELFRTTGYVSASGTVTAKRAQRGTVIAAHAIGDYLTLTPTYPRLSVFEAIRDNIIMLSPKLFTVSNDNLVQVSERVAPIDDDLAVEVLSVWAESWGSTIDHHARIVDYHPLTGGRALVTNLVMGSLWVRYRRRMGIITAETDELEDVGVEEVWSTIIMAGVAADLLVGRDLPQTQADFIGSILQTEAITPGTRTSIAVGLARYRDVLLERFQQEMKVEYRVKVRMRDPFDVRT